MLEHSLGNFVLGSGDLNSVIAVANSNWLSPGPQVQSFEEAIANLHNNRFGVMTNSGTDALRIAIHALKEKYGWKDGDRIIVPAITFVATANIVIQAGLTPIFADVSMYDFNINPDNVFRRFFQSDNRPDNIRAIIPVHLAGRPAPMKRIMELASKYGLRVIEDSCESIGIPGIGHGDVTCFSFYMAHLLTTGVGGMALTNDPDLRYLLWSYCNHGRREAKSFVFDRIGFSCRPTEFEAALGLSQLHRLNQIILKRRSNYEFFHEGLYNKVPDLYIPGLDSIDCYDQIGNSCMFIPMILHEDSKFNKWDLMRYLNEDGIETRELMPLVNQPCYVPYLKEQDPFPIADWVNRSGFYIGCHQDLTTERLERTISRFKSFFATGGPHAKTSPGISTQKDISG